MSQTDTYRPAVLPSEAVMIPAAEAPEERSAQEPVQERTQEPRQNAAGAGRGIGASLERMRMESRMLYSRPLNWMNSQLSPLDLTNQPSALRGGRNLTPSSTPLTRRNTVSQGAALSTLMRSAARRYSPPPMLRVPSYNMDVPLGMRGALRTVVTQAQSGMITPAKG